MKIFLDDVRDPSVCLGYMWQRIGNLNLLYKEEWYVVRNYEDFADIIDKFKGKITHISFDHDLADIHYNPETQTESFEYDEKTGYDAAIYFKKVYEEDNLKFPVLFVHSMNPIGTQNIINIFK